MSASTPPFHPSAPAGSITAAPLHSPPAHGDENGDLAHQFANLEQQHEANTLGMWAFLSTEVLFFGGIFTGYFIYRSRYGVDFLEACKQLSVPLGTTNTVVLICSSLTMALALHLRRTGQKRALVGYMIATLILGTAFLGIKAYEWTSDYYEQLAPGFNFRMAVAAPGENVTEHGSGHEVKWPSDVDPHKAELFFVFYFCMTGLHGLHMIVGLVILAILLYYASRGRFTKQYFTPIEVFGLYWHFVDIVWVFLFPLLYLIRS